MFLEFIGNSSRELGPLLRADGCLAWASCANAKWFGRISRYGVYLHSNTFSERECSMQYASLSVFPARYSVFASHFMRAALPGTQDYSSVFWTSINVYRVQHGSFIDGLRSVSFTNHRGFYSDQQGWNRMFRAILPVFVRYPVVPELWCARTPASDRNLRRIRLWCSGWEFCVCDIR